MNPEEEVTLLFDTKLKQPACALLQAVAGVGDNAVLSHFDNWLTSPTPAMRRVTGTRKQWEQLASKQRKDKP